VYLLPYANKSAPQEAAYGDRDEDAAAASTGSETQMMDHDHDGSGPMAPGHSFAELAEQVQVPSRDCLRYVMVCCVDATALIADNSAAHAGQRRH